MATPHSLSLSHYPQLRATIGSGIVDHAAAPPKNTIWLSEGTATDSSPSSVDQLFPTVVRCSGVGQVGLVGKSFHGIVHVALVDADVRTVVGKRVFGA